MYHRQKKSSIIKTLNSQIFLVVSLLVLCAVSFGLFKITYRKIQIKKEISAIEQKIQSLENSGLKLVHLLDYLNTNSYQEETARIELGYKKPDEKVIVITKESNHNQQNLKTELLQEKEAELKISNPKKWWRYFFKNQ